MESRVRSAIVSRLPRAKRISRASEVSLARVILTGAGLFVDVLMLSGILRGPEFKVNNDENDQSRSQTYKHCSKILSSKKQSHKSYNLIAKPNIDTVKMNGWFGFGVAASEPEEMGATDEDAPHAPTALSLSSRSTTASSSWSWSQPQNSLSSSESLAPACKPPVRIPVENEKMKVIHLAIVKNATRPAVDLCVESDLSSYSRFMRGR